MQEIILKPGISPIKEYNDFYSFLSEQVITEIQRTITKNTITKDTTPIKVEELLMDAIMTSCMRFGVYDREVYIGYGYAILINDDPSYIDNLSAIQKKFPYPVDMKHIRTVDKLYDVAADEESELYREISIDIASGYTNLDKYDDVFNPNMTSISNTIYRGTERIEELISEFAPPNRKVTEMPIYLGIFGIIKSEASIPALRDMNISAKDVTSMLYMDIIDQAISVVNNAPDMINSK